MPRPRRTWASKGAGKIRLPHYGFRSPEGTIVRPPANGGSPSSYTDEIGRAICLRIMKGESLKRICEDVRMPAFPTVIKWLAAPRFDAFRELYYHSRRVYAELLVDEIIEIADDSSNDWKKTFNKKGEHNGWTPDNEAIQRSRVRIDARKWLASKLIPRIYGEHVDVTHGVSSELKELLQQASNNDTGLPPPPPPIEGEFSEG